MYYLKLIFIVFIISCVISDSTYAVQVDISINTKNRQVVQGEIIIEIKRGIIDSEGEKGVVPLEKVNIKSKSMEVLNKKYNLISVEKLFSGIRKNNPSDIYVFKFSPKVNIDELISDYKNDSSVIYVEPNYTVSVKID